MGFHTCLWVSTMRLLLPFLDTASHGEVKDPMIRACEIRIRRSLFCRGFSFD